VKWRPCISSEGVYLGSEAQAQILADLRLCCSDEIPDITPLPTLFTHHFIQQGMNYSPDYPLLRHADTRRPAVLLRRWIDWSGKVHTDGYQQKRGGARPANPPHASADRLFGTERVLSVWRSVGVPYLAHGRLMVMVARYV